MARAHEPDCEAVAADSRHPVQSEEEGEEIDLAERHTCDGHGQDDADEEPRSTHLKIA